MVVVCSSMCDDTSIEEKGPAPVSMRESFGLLALIGCTATSVSLALTLEGFFISKEGETLNVPNLALEDALAVVASINT